MATSRIGPRGSVLSTAAFGDAFRDGILGTSSHCHAASTEQLEFNSARALLESEAERNEARDRENFAGGKESDVQYAAWSQ